MDTTKRVTDTAQRLLRTWLSLNNALILSSSAIITGILAHFIRKYHERGTHVIFQEAIAVVTLFLYLFAMFAPALKGYRGYLLPLNLALSYLWLTNLIFSSQDYSGHRCHYHSPAHRGHCSLKHAVQAFNILGFTSLLSSVVAETLMWFRSRGSSPGTTGSRLGNGEKGSAPLTSNPGATTGGPTTTDATNGTRV
ncbi:hypothetical protein SMACR_07723 [Sordaria macrospora]|uniref:WGS project CABT00000000 data, contig 2.47 n=2 Tax=Sordaria macrospora TaxID=5147 RepID=F7W8U3_SORMK|nr:uncharacterized protein SMAC_07723 [Sordaria macrospora k-hell]KAA8627830.1 hypothetical protein SMACR_07723 [Sordaria macrospora]WPJ66391.1 hypothetical protein SMAC4_07723 [Sordaria macrospora]CCC05066.1 unnamed protein product [Sordaria macrospora k-hell]